LTAAEPRPLLPGGHRGFRPDRAVHRSALVDPPL